MIVLIHYAGVIFPIVVIICLCQHCMISLITEHQSIMTIIAAITAYKLSIVPLPSFVNSQPLFFFCE